MQLRRKRLNINIKWMNPFLLIPIRSKRQAEHGIIEESG
jgi:hypothetical protein